MHRDLKLLCEYAAYPLATQESITWAGSQLVRDKLGQLDQDTQELSKCLDEEATHRRAGLARERWWAARDVAWFGRDGELAKTVTLSALIARLSKAFLCWDGRLRVRTDGGQGKDDFFEPDTTPEMRALTWQILCRHLCPDLLLAAFATTRPLPDIDLSHCFIPLADPSLDRLFAKGLSDTHLHSGAALPSTVLWQERMRPRSFGDTDHNARAIFARLAILRALMGEFLWAGGGNAKFEDFLIDGLPPIAGHAGLAVAPLRRICLGGLSAEILQPDMMALPLAQALLGPYAVHAMSRSGKTPLGRDPLLALAPRRDIPAEMALLTSSLQYIEGQEKAKGDTMFARIFWQYIRAKHCLHHQKIVLNEGVPGMSRFTEAFKHLRGPKSGLPQRMIYSQAVSIHLDSGPLELRATPNGPRFRRELADLAHALRERPLINDKDGEVIPVGLILHLAKSPGEDRRFPDHKKKQNVPHAPPDAWPDTPGRYGRLSRQYAQEMEAVESLLRRLPLLRKLLVGIDICGTELDVPTWVYAGLLHGLRQGLAASPPRHTPSWWRPPGLTCHAGEDFLHLAQGLRLMGETMDHMQMRAGDRIGHGLALGIDPEQWCIENPMVTLPSEEYLDDLIWEWSLYRNGLAASSGVVNWLEEKILNLAETIYRPLGNSFPIRVEDLHRAYRLRFDIATVEHIRRHLTVGDLESWATNVRPEERLLIAYLSDTGVYGRGRQPRLVQVHGRSSRFARHNDEERLEAMQRYLRQRVAEKGIVIEAAPSSNLVVRSIPRYGTHPIFRLRPGPGAPAENRAARVMVSLNTDDPATLHTVIPNEFAHIALAAPVRDFPCQEDILDWLEEIRRIGVESSFIPAEGLTEDDLKEIIWML